MSKKVPSDLMRKANEREPWIVLCCIPSAQSSTDGSEGENELEAKMHKQKVTLILTAGHQIDKRTPQARA